MLLRLSIKTMLWKSRLLSSRKQGQGLVEWLAIIALIVVVIGGVLFLVHGAANQHINLINNELNNQGT